MVVNDAVVKAGRTYKVTMNGAQDVKVKYQVLLQSPLLPSEVPTSFPGVPAIGTAHPSRLGYYALSYDVSQPEGAAKHTLDVTVNYGPADITITDPTQQHPAEIIEEVTEWGWDDGTGEKELVTSVAVGNEAAKPVLNSAGDVFDSAPSVTMPAPTFTKVMRRSERFSDWQDYFCTVNDAQVTIGSVVCLAGTLLCTVSERKLVGEWRLPYEYTVRLRFRSNVVANAEPQTNNGEIGWDVAITDAGMREKDDTTGKLKLIQVIADETGQPATVTSPELLDGHGHAISRSASGSAATPKALVFHAYRRATFPTWFYSEPPTPQPPDDDEEDN